MYRMLTQTMESLASTVGTILIQVQDGCRKVQWAGAGCEARELSSAQIPAYLQCTGMHICTDSS